MTDKPSDEELNLPPLPEPDACCGDLNSGEAMYTEDQMREYAKKATRAAFNEAEELRRDADRYRWLRDHYGLGSLDHADKHLMETGYVGYWGSSRGLDRSIDAVIEAEKGEHHEK